MFALLCRGLRTIDVFLCEDGLGWCACEISECFSTVAAFDVRVASMQLSPGFLDDGHPELRWLGGSSERWFTCLHWEEVVNIDCLPYAVVTDLHAV